jgi:hypothetical protein
MPDGNTAQTLIDKKNIEELILLYAVGVDTLNWPLYRSIYEDDIETDFTSYSGGEPQKLKADDWVAQLKAFFPGLDASQHTLTNFLIDVNGDEATAMVYMSAAHFLQNRGGDGVVTLGGYYTHHLRRGSQGWKVRKTKLTVTWNTGNRDIYMLAAQRVANGQGRDV